MSTDDTPATETKEMRAILTRFKRIQGQLRGIEKMIDEGVESDAILVQMSAVISAMTSVRQEFVKVQLLKNIEGEIEKVSKYLK